MTVKAVKNDDCFCGGDLFGENLFINSYFDKLEIMELSEAAKVLDAPMTGKDCSFRNIAIDSRSLGRGDLYVALRGENFDGHEFISHAIEQGAVATVVEKKAECPVPSIVVPDTRLALGRLASNWRSTFDGPLIGLTGSNGKTTVKEMLAVILERKGSVLATKGNLNNDIGVPLTLFRLQSHHRYAVIEMGANHAGEIGYLTNIAAPSVALITNAAPAHLEGFGSLDGVAKAKGEIFEGLSEEGVAVINFDDPYYDLWKSFAGKHDVVSFGLDEAADVSATWVKRSDGSEIELHATEGSVHISLAMPGRHNVMNALAASATALAVGASLADIKAGLETMLSVPGRSQRKSGVSGSVIIDDTYNANPASLDAALDMLCTGAGEKIIVLGDMAELGDDARMLHQEAGRKIFSSGVDAFYALGEFSCEAVKTYSDAGGENGFCFETQGALLDAIRTVLRADVTVLVKGSRSMRMERIVVALTDKGES